MNGLVSPQVLYSYVIRALVMLIVIPFHEAAHALVSWKLGDSTAKDAGRLSLNPVRHFDPLGALCMVVGGVGWAKPVDINPGRFKDPKRGMALSAAAGIAGMENAAVFSVGSDGTDGPTDAAGGYVDGSTAARLENLGLSIPAVLAENDAYHALQAADGLIITGPTGTNVNDLSVALLRPAE